MKKTINIILNTFIFFIISVFAHGLLNAENTSIKVQVTKLRGKAFLTKEKEKSLIVPGDFLYKGDVVDTEKNSKLEITLPDKSIMRFDELTTFTLKPVTSIENQKKIHICLLSGKIWAKIFKCKKQGLFAISTITAITKACDTVLTINANKDNSSEINIYQGEAVVNSINKVKKNYTDKIITESTVISSPDKPEADKWSYIIKSMQKIIVRSDSNTTEPFRFSSKENPDKWVTWSQNKKSK